MLDQLEDLGIGGQVQHDVVFRLARQVGGRALTEVEEGCFDEVGPTVGAFVNAVYGVAPLKQRQPDVCTNLPARTRHENFHRPSFY